MPSTSPRWMRIVLLFAGAYNLAWGTWTILSPMQSFAYSGMQVADRPLYYPQLWQCIGMIVGVYGVGYALAAKDPVRHWPIVLVGLLGKVFGPLGVAYGVIEKQTPIEAVATIIPNDLIWWIPFALILLHAYRVSRSAL